MVSVLAAVELRTSFVEDLAGRYLNARNSHRPPLGRTWEQRQNFVEAAEKLEEAAQESDRLAGEAALVADLGALIALIPPDGGLNLTPEKFTELYKGLPPPLRSRIAQPEEIASIYISGDWQRTALWRRGAGAIAYLIDARNRILKHYYMESGVLAAAELYGKTFNGGLLHLPRFKGRVYSAPVFFHALFALSESERQDLFLAPEALLDLPRTVTRVGMGSIEGTDDLSAVGFEYVDDNGVRVVTWPVNSAPLSQLLRLIDQPESSEKQIDKLPESRHGVVR